MSKFGSASVWFLVDGYSMIVNKLQGLSYKITSITEPTHGLGDSWEEHTPVGLSKAEITQEGAFFDTTAAYIHEVLSTSIGGQAPTSSAKVVCMGFSGNTSGETFVGFKGEYSQDYEVLGSVGKLQRANATYVVTGNAEQGNIIFPSTNTTSDVSYFQDQNAATTLGAAIYIQITSISLGGSTGATIYAYEATATSGAYTDLGLTTSTGIGAWRIETTDDTIQRYVAATAFAGDGNTVTAFVGLARH